MRYVSLCVPLFHPPFTSRSEEFEVHLHTKQAVICFHLLSKLGISATQANYNNFNGNRTPMDLMGFDYGPEMYDKWHAEAPQAPAISSETSSAYSDRGAELAARMLQSARFGLGSQFCKLHLKWLIESRKVGKGQVLEQG